MSSARESYVMFSYLYTHTHIYLSNIVLESCSQASRVGMWRSRKGQGNARQAQAEDGLAEALGKQAGREAGCAPSRARQFRERARHGMGDPRRIRVPWRDSRPRRDVALRGHHRPRDCGEGIARPPPLPERAPEVVGARRGRRPPPTPRRKTPKHHSNILRAHRPRHGTPQAAGGTQEVFNAGGERRRRAAPAPRCPARRAGGGGGSAGSAPPRRLPPSAGAQAAASSGGGRMRGGGRRQRRLEHRSLRR